MCHTANNKFDFHLSRMCDNLRQEMDITTKSIREIARNVLSAKASTQQITWIYTCNGDLKHKLIDLTKVEWNIQAQSYADFQKDALMGNAQMAHRISKLAPEPMVIQKETLHMSIEDELLSEQAK